MSLLWKSRVIRQIETIHKRPSPKHNNHILNFAQSLISVLDRHFPHKNTKALSIKGISVFISDCGYIKASMTVEAAMVLPLFLFFFINLSSSIEMMRLHGNLQLALWEVGNRMTVYGSVLDRDEVKEHDSVWTELAGVAWSYTYIREQIKAYLGENYLENSPLALGTKGLQFLESDIYESQDCFAIVVTYKVAPVSGMGAFTSFRMANKYYGHLWNGYEIPQNEEMVYVTENGEVYHLSRDCTHLQLSVRRISWQEMCNSKNAQGEKYERCQKCCEILPVNTVYVTEDGECYHCTAECSGLKRTIMGVWISEVTEMNCCRRCKEKSN